MYVYLAEPSDNNVGEWKFNIDRLASEIGAFGHTVYRPRPAWEASRFGDASDPADLLKLNRINRVALDSADLVVAVMPPNTTTRGVPMEIGWASDLDIPVLLFTTAQVAASTLFRGDPNVHWADTVGGVLGMVQRATLDGGLLPRGHHLQDMRGVPRESSLALRYTMDPDHPNYPNGLTKHYGGDAGFDLYTKEDVELTECQYTMIPCGVRIELPEGVFGQIVARSSTFPNWGIIVLPGVIDTGWRGEMAVPCWRVPSGSVWTTDDGQPYNRYEPNGNGHSPKTPAPFRIPAGTRLAQLVLYSNVAAGFRSELVDTIADAERGTKGFGSTGDGPGTRVVDVHAERPVAP